MSDLWVNTRTLTFPGGRSVAGVSVSLHDGTGQLATGTTDVDGMVYLGNRPAGTYELRVTPPSGYLPISGNRINLTVAGDDGEVVFDVLLLANTVTAPADPMLCRCYGEFRDGSGRPVPNATFAFSEGTLPQLLYNQAADTTVGLLPRTFTVQTDARGFVAVDLIRGASYAVTVSSFANATIEIEVPELALSSLPDILFPTLDRVEYRLNNSTLLPATAPTLTMQVGQTLTIPVESIYRSGVRKAGIPKAAFFVADNNVIIIGLTGGTNLVITAVAAGTAVVEVRPSELEKTRTLQYPAIATKGFLTVTVNS